MPCVSSPESLVVAGYQMQSFVSARDEGERDEMVTPGTAVLMSLVRQPAVVR